MNSDIQITLSEDEALVLFEFFARFQETDILQLKNNAEFIALSTVSAQLDKILPHPFLSNYTQLLNEAQARLAGDYDGLAPGVRP
ncbi:hypothetical protein KSF73_09335 [Burkholderiaceae bacterium DAT-1]|nr:hypothetical protein [Burkholderiaceae bacterium DAT-1]